MDYLDSKKQMRHSIILFVGYILIAVAIGMASIVMMYQAYGFGLGKNGIVIQNGLTFFSSHPNPAKIYVNGAPNASTTNTRLALPEGIYRIILSRSGYYNWQRTIELTGGSVTHFDYPFLFPRVLTTNKIATFNSAANSNSPPALVTQSPDRRWLIISKPDSLSDFDVYDLKNPTKPPVNLSLPANLLTKASSGEGLKLAEWADDNQHVLLQHDFDGKKEFILLDRTSPELSTNLNTNLSTSSTGITLRNKKFDQYYLYDLATGSLQAASSKSSDKVPILQHALAYKPYGNDTILYITDAGAPAGKVLVKMVVGDKVSTIRALPASPNYLVDLTQYSGTMYVVAGASASSKVYIYKDPLGQLANNPGQAVVPIQVLHVNQPNYLSFSNNTQFIVTENGSYFGVYDIENDNGYNYSTASAPDSPMPHAEWMDGNRLYYIKGGKLDIFDYDHTNEHVLVPASSQYLPAFAPDYKYVYTISQDSAGQYELNQTWLLAPADR